MNSNKTEQPNWFFYSTIGLFFIGVILILNQDSILKYLEQSSSIVPSKKETKTEVYSLTQGKFTLGIAEFYYTDYIIPSNRNLDYFYIPSSSKNTSIVRKDTIPSLTQIVIEKNKITKYPFGIETVDKIDDDYKFILTIPGDAYIEFFKQESDLERLIIRNNFENSSLKKK